MKARRTVTSTGVLRLEGGNEDNDLWYESLSSPSGLHIFQTVWEPTAEERAAIAGGSNIYLRVWGLGHPPVSMGCTGVQLGRAPAA